MSFVTLGLAIAGAAAILIPIIIHLLFRQRKRPIQWAAMRFLLEAFRKHKKRLRIEQILLLTVRCLILGLLGMALARPLLESSGILAAAGSNRVVYIVIDNGLASGVTDETGATALSKHVEQAVKVIRELDAGDMVGLITAARPATAVLSPPTTDHEAVVGLLESMAPTQSATDIPGAVRELQSVLASLESDRGAPLVYLFSEFRSGSAALDIALPETLAGMTENVTLLSAPPTRRAATNVQIVSIDPVRNVIVPGVSDASGQITVRLARQGDDLSRAVTQVRLSGLNVPPLEPQTVTWDKDATTAEASFYINFPLRGDEQAVLTATIDDDALEADNQRHGILELRERLRVIVADRRSFRRVDADGLTAGQWIIRALEPMTDDGPIEVYQREPEAIDAIELRAMDAVFLPRPDLVTDQGWKSLREFIDRGGLVIITPPSEINVHPWTDRLASDFDLPWRIMLEVEQHDEGLLLAAEQPPSDLFRLLANDLTVLTATVVSERVLPIDDAETKAQRVLMFENGSPMVIVGRPSNVADGEANGPELDESEDDQETEAVQRGMVIYIAVAPHWKWSNLGQQPLMVPLFQESLRQGLGLILAAQTLHVGEQPRLLVGRVAEDLLGPQGEPLALDGDRRPVTPFTTGGVYTVRDAAEQGIGSLAVNIDPTAGQTGLQSSAAVEQWLGKSGKWSFFETDDPAKVLRTARSGLPLAGILLIGVFVLVCVETALARWFSHARGGKSAAGLSGGLATSMSEMTTRQVGAMR